MSCVLIINMFTLLDSYNACQTENVAFSSSMHALTMVNFIF